MKPDDAKDQNAATAGESRITAMTEAEIGSVSGGGVGSYVLATVELSARQLLRLLLN
jgi:hypothetical protein